MNKINSDQSFADFQYHMRGNSTAWSLHAPEFIFSEELQEPDPQLSGLFHSAGNQILCNAVISCYKCLQNPLEPGLGAWAHSSDFIVSQGTTQ